MKIGVLRDINKEKILNKICSIFNLDTLEAYIQEESSQNIVYKVTTNKGIYIIKEFSKDAISNYYYLTKRKKQIDIPCTYKKINIDLDKLLSISKDNDILKSLINKNKEKLIDLINICNNNLSLMKNNLCISHNDYKHKNILWNNLTPVLIDFDASGLSNPTCCLSESAFTFSRFENEINYEHYKTYLEQYIKTYGKIKEDYKIALYVSMNGKLQWYNYLISKKRINDVISMTKELLLFYNSIDKFYKIYESVI